MAIREIKFDHIDYWGRAMFVDIKGFWFSTLEKLVYGKTPEEIYSEVTENDLTYHGMDPEDDPDGRKIKPGVLKIVKEYSNVY